MADEELEKENKKLKNENGLIATLQVKLRGISKELESKVESLREKKSLLESEIIETDKQKKIRENQRNDELNKKGEELKGREEILEKSIVRVNDSKYTIKQKASDLDAAIKKMDDCRCQLEASTLELNQKIKSIDIKSEQLDNLIKERTSNVTNNQDIRNKLQDQINAHINKSRECDRAIKEAENAKQSCRVLEDDLNKRIVTLNEKIAGTQSGLKRVEEQNAILKNKVNDAQKQRDLYETKYYGLNEQAKQIQLGWLQLNKKARDKGIDLEIEKLKDA